MPQYTFACKDCGNTFSQVMHVADLAKGGIKCPKCGGDKVEQEIGSFFAVTSKKS